VKIISQGSLKIGVRADILLIKQFEIRVSGSKQLFDHKNLAKVKHVGSSSGRLAGIYTMIVRH
jgi:hypothetical protein